MEKGTVIISTEEYRSLIQDSVKLAEVMEYATSEDYIMQCEVRRILGVKPQKDEKAGEE